MQLIQVDRPGRLKVGEPEAFFGDDPSRLGHPLQLDRAHYTAKESSSLLPRRRVPLKTMKNENRSEVVPNMQKRNLNSYRQIGVWAFVAVAAASISPRLTAQNTPRPGVAANNFATISNGVLTLL